MQTQRYTLALDLIDDSDLIAEYENYHKKVWPDILASITDAGIVEMEIYRVANRLFMIMEVNDQFSFEQKEVMDNSNAKVQEWEALMWKYQQAIPGSQPGEKWRRMDLVFSLRG